jgi:O-antigen/teichoic acid export membrane protein
MASKLSGFIGETIVYGFANVFSRVFAMLLIPFYATYLGKIDYSNLVMLQSLFTILTFMLALNSGVFFYYYEYENPKYRKIVFTSWFYFELVLSLIFILLLFVSSSGIKNLLIVNSSNSYELIVSILLIGLQLIPYTFNNTNINLFRIDRKPKKVMVIVFFEALLTLIFVYLTLYIFHFGLIGVMLGQIAARTVIALAFARTAKFYTKFRNFSSRLLKKIVLYTWPFFIISIFGWVITSMDKFIGTQTLTDKTDVALLSLAMQLVIPIAVLADMIRMAIGPFVMSIHKDKDADNTYQQVFDLSIFASTVIVICVVVATPFLSKILTNETFNEVIILVPIMAFANVISLAANQFSICFNLVKKNIYILYATVIAGVLGILINYLYMSEFGFVVSGISQLVSYLAMAAFLFFTGRKIANQKLQLKNSLIILIPFTFFIVWVYFFNVTIINGTYLPLLLIGISCIVVLTMIYLKTQKISFKSLLKR